MHAAPRVALLEWAAGFPFWSRTCRCASHTRRRAPLPPCQTPAVPVCLLVQDEADYEEPDDVWTSGSSNSTSSDTKTGGGAAATDAAKAAGDQQETTRQAGGADDVLGRDADGKSDKEAAAAAGDDAALDTTATTGAAVAEAAANALATVKAGATGGLRWPRERHAVASLVSCCRYPCQRTTRAPLGRSNTLMMLRPESALYEAYAMRRHFRMS